MKKKLKTNIKVLDEEYNVAFRGRTPTSKAGINRVINEVFFKNEEKLTQKTEQLITNIKASGTKVKGTTPYNLFKSTVNSFLEEGYNVRDAVKMAVNTEGYTDRTYKNKVNLVSGLKKSGAFDDLRRMYGWKNKFDIDKLSYDKDAGAYKYSDIAWIIAPDFSPKDGSSGFTFVPFED